jgi:hypothetical protein
MTRYHAIALASLALALCSATPAAGQGWGRGILEKMSGPGPFYGDDGRLTAFCVTRDGGDDPPVRPLWVVNPNRKTLFCLDIDYTNYQNEEEDRDENGLITFNRYQGLLMFPVGVQRAPGEATGGADATAPRPSKPFLEVGAGLGRAKFAGTAFELSRVVIPIRAAIKPLRLPGIRNPIGSARWSGVPKLEYTGMFIPQHLRSGDFGVEHEFDHIYLSGFSFVLDFSELLAR